MNKELMKVYEAIYCPCVHESAYTTISIHASREGALKAIASHKQEKLELFNKRYGNQKEKYVEMIFGEHEHWDINETKLLP